MYAFVLAFALGGLRPAIPDGLPVAPVDVVAGQQHIDLRAPLVARTPGTRIVLFVRQLSELVEPGAPRRDAFQRAVPPGSVSARLSNTDGTALDFEHTGYVYHRGYAGIVLTETAPGSSRTRYDRLALRSAVDLPGVQFIWLDQHTRRVQDLGQIR